MNKHIVEFVRLGYNQAQAFEFMVDVRSDWATFRACLDVIAGAYGDFYRLEASHEFESLFDELSTAEVGRDGSPIFRVILPFWASQKVSASSGDRNRPLANAELKTLAQQIIDAAQRLHADGIRVEQFDRATWEAGEVDAETGDHPYAIRLWWH